MQNNKFIEFRKKYKEFIYDKFELYEKDNKIIIKYYFEITDLAKFNPIIEIDKKEIKFNDIDNDYVKNLAFNIGMVELISYWKCACPSKVILKCGYLNEEQIQWFKKLYFYGLGEYRYVNNITMTQDEMMQIIVEQDYKEVINNNEYTNSGILIPIGGGKDSTVTLELLKKYKKDNYCLIVGGKQPSIDCAHIAGYEDNQIIEVKRTIDSNLIELNKNGFLNGHTPFSALLAFLSYFIAFLTNKKYIALSNESSAEETNVEGEKINHQYSKSYEFEKDFQYYSQKYLKGDIKYFSMLRPINELQIAMLFSKNEQYHSTFKSCNVGSKQIPWVWCGNCPKCLFVFIILSPFLYSSGKLTKIFGQDLLQKERLLETFKELCGYGKTKPFECVGTYEEVNFAITKTILELEKENKKLPYLLQFYKDNYKLVDISKDLTKQYNEENSVPKELEEILKGKIFND